MLNRRGVRREYYDTRTYIYIYGYTNLPLLMSGDKKFWIFYRAWYEIKTRHEQRNTVEPSCYHCSSGEAVNTTCLECVCVALSIQHAMCMRHIVIGDLPGSKIFFHIISHAAQFYIKKLLNIKGVFLFSLHLLSETFLILRITERNMIKMYIGPHVKYPLFLSDFTET